MYEQSKTKPQAKKNTNSNCRLVRGEAEDENAVGNDSFTHIMCLYFSIYYIKDMHTRIIIHLVQIDQSL